MDETSLPDRPLHMGRPAYRYRSSWGHYYNSFATSLAQLESFKVSFYDPDPDLPHNISFSSNEDRYLYYYYGDWFPTEGLVMQGRVSIEVPFAERLRIDEDALKRLLDIVAKRRTTKI